jgi:hypothetical protein
MFSFANEAKYCYIVLAKVIRTPRKNALFGLKFNTQNYVYYLVPSTESACIYVYILHVDCVDETKNKHNTHNVTLRYNVAKRTL